jgi:hypothetical protein
MISSKLRADKFLGQIVCHSLLSPASLSRKLELHSFSRSVIPAQTNKGACKSETDVTPLNLAPLPYSYFHDSKKI